MTHFHFQVGDFSCIAIQDVEISAPAERFFGNSDSSERDQLVYQHGLDPALLVGSNTCLVVQVGDQWVLVDSGNGVAMPNRGQMVENMRKADLAPDDIQLVILSHGHGDHYGGLIDEQGEFIFKNAHYLMWKGEWDFWTSEARMVEIEAESPERATLIRQHLKPIETRLTLLEYEHEILPGVCPFYAPGHTPHHIGLSFCSQNEELLYIGDAALHPFHLMKLEWEFFNDSDHTTAKATRRQLAQRAIESKALVMGYHFAFPGLGYLEDACTWRNHP